LSEAGSESGSSASKDRSNDAGDQERPRKKVRIVEPERAGKETATKTVSSPNAEPSSSRYVPPHLRNNGTTDSSSQSTTVKALDDDPRLRRLLLGKLNRLSSSNVPIVLSEIESTYRSHPRAVVSSVLIDLIIGIVSGRDNLSDSFVVTYAGFVTLLNRTVGKEFGAGLVARAVGDYDGLVEKAKVAKDDAAEAAAASAGEATVEEEVGARAGGKERTNLVAFLAELYNFRVIACPLIYDFIRSFIDNGLDEFDVELLLKVVKSGAAFFPSFFLFGRCMLTVSAASGSQLRQDDPSALKQIIQLVNEKQKGKDPKGIR
jgi:nucleolar MIF4G domain-containing protein 1